MLDIIFEDKNILVVNKISGVVVNNSITIKTQTLQDEISKYINLEKNDLGVGDRAGIVHRLDRETSGLILIAKDERTFANLQSQFKNREVEKEYVALVHGNSKEKKGNVNLPISRIGRYGKFGVSKDGKLSETRFGVKDELTFKTTRFSEILDVLMVNKNKKRYYEQNALNYSLISFFPKTGRTHQIRVHSKSLGMPIVSDLIYCPSKLISFDLSWCPRLFLHAKSIRFKHPKTKKYIEFQSHLPNELKSAILNLRKI